VSVPDVGAVRRFYEALGFAPTYAVGDDDDPDFVTVERDGDVIGISRRTGDERFATWVYVDDVDAAFASLTAAGAAVVADPSDRPWGERVASVRDPDGNVVHLGSPLT
jgi:predicted enzyme related to lactoylglutathione lyase